MFNHIDLDYAFNDLECNTTEDGRSYLVPQPEGGFLPYPSVTTVTGFDKKDFFTEWRSQPGNHAKSEYALHRGNTVHDTIEQYLKNEFTDFSHVNEIPIRNILNTMNPMLKKIDNIRALEVPLFSHTLQIAGRVDCVAEYEGKLAIIDFKGSDKEKKEEWILNYFQQATAYSIMWEEMTGQRIDDIVIIIGTELGFCQVFKKGAFDYVPELFKTITRFREFTRETDNVA